MTVDPLSFLKDAQALKQRVSTTLEQLKGVTAQGSSGGGIVKVTLNGQFNMVSVALDPIAVDPRDVPMLQDLIVAAHHDAAEKIKAALQEKIGPAISEMPL